MKMNALVKAVGKYKDKFKTTGLLLETPQGEFWADVPGNLDYKKYKGKSFDFDLEQNEKGYWRGKFVGGTPSGGGCSGGEDKNRSFAMSYAKDLVVAGKLNISELVGGANKILAWLEGKAPAKKPIPEPEPEDVNVNHYEPEPESEPDDDIPF